jgi:hypothetical protein
MGHPIFKHMSSSQRYDNKQAYNKDLSDSARLHYLENEEHDKGMSRKSSPANNVSYGTGYIGKPSAAYMNVDPAEAVMSGDEDTRQGVKRGSSYKKK